MDRGRQGSTSLLDRAALPASGHSRWLSPPMRPPQAGNSFGGIAIYSGTRLTCQTRANLIVRMSSYATRGLFDKSLERFVSQFTDKLGSFLVPRGGSKVSGQTPPNSRSQRRVATANVPQIMGKISSQIAIEDIHGRSVSQGTKAPIAKDCISPRPKIAVIRNGVGKTQHTVTKNNDPMKSRNDEANPMMTAATITAIRSHAKLDRKRGSGNQPREDRVGNVSGSGMIHPTTDEFPRTTQPNHTIPSAAGHTKGDRQPLGLCRPWRRRGRGLAGAGDKFLRGFRRL
jgi:hypothetical protein